jgi:hypothetical protein
MNFLRAYLLALRGTIPETGKSVNTKVEDDARTLLGESEKFVSSCFRNAAWVPAALQHGMVTHIESIARPDCRRSCIRYPRGDHGSHMATPNLIGRRAGRGSAQRLNRCGGMK